VWVTDVSGSGAVRGFAADGAEVGRVEVPAKMVTSLCFGGADRRDLYIVTADNTETPERGGTIFRTRADVPGCEVAPARV
jgi:sugar lactone lactonase YvrE